jgi:hypothetical protein
VKLSAVSDKSKPKILSFFFIKIRKASNGEFASSDSKRERSVPDGSKYQIKIPDTITSML